ncbi:MAG: helix-hairpin-helix domain-containing protein [Candidatus Limnocylindrales bacterium]
MKIEDVEGIGPAYAAKLAAAGVTTTDDLLEQGWIDAAKDLPRVVEH